MPSSTSATVLFDWPTREKKKLEEIEEMESDRTYTALPYPFVFVAEHSSKEREGRERVVGLPVRSM